MKRNAPFALIERFDKLPMQHEPTAQLIACVRSCVGINEKENSDIIDLFQSTISRDTNQSWCLDFLQACISYVEKTFSVVSPLGVTEMCMNLWDTAPLQCKVPKGSQKMGDIIVWQLNTSPMHGHVGLYLSEDANLYQTVEGNTTAAHYIQNQGDGVYLKNRLKGGSETFKELGFLRVFP